MPAGFQAFNTFGTLVADMTTPTLTLRNKITVTVPAGAGTIRFVDQLFTNCDIPVFAFRPNGANRNFFADVSTVVGQPTQRSVRCWTAREVIVSPDDSEPVSFDTNNTTSFTVTIYHFDRPATPGASGFGLQLFDELSRCTFDSNQKPARVLRSLSGAFGYDDFTFPTSVAPAVIPSHNWLYETRNNPFDGWHEIWWRENWRFGGNRVESFDLFSHNFISLSGGPAISRPNGRSSGIFVDVLGY